MRFNSKAISSLIATVLMILITIAAVGIIVQAVMPMIRGNIEAANNCEKTKLAINSELGFTCYDSINNTVSLLISRGPENVGIDGFQIRLINSNGTSKILEVRNGTAYGFIDSSQMPGLNAEKLYVINGTNASISGVERAAVIPIIKIGKTSKVCSSSGVVELPRCS